MDLSVVPYSHISPSESAPDNNKKVEKNGHGNGRVVDPLESPEKQARNIGIQYRECLKNHAASIGGHANDGCGEFMPSGEDGTMEALKCAACGCHRNFHRKELPGCDYPVPTGFCYNAGPGWDFPGKKKMGFPALPPILPHVDLHQRAQSVVENKCSEEQDQTGSLARKRFRTKFTQDQKDKMLAFAEKLGWRIQKHDDVALQQFCMEVGVKRHVLKVWMHNNKNTLGKKEAVTV